MDSRIVKFLGRHHVMTLATVEALQPWCSNLFYAFDKKHYRLVFTSSESTRHISEVLNNPLVACSIVLESRVVGRLQGAQICGRLCDASLDAHILEQCRTLFLKRFPYVALNLERLWYVDIESAKYTDNTLGFGKKLYFSRNDQY